MWWESSSRGLCFRNHMETQTASQNTAQQPEASDVSHSQVWQQSQGVMLQSHKLLNAKGRSKSKRKRQCGACDQLKAAMYNYSVLYPSVQASQGTQGTARKKTAQFPHMSPSAKESLPGFAVCSFCSSCFLQFLCARSVKGLSIHSSCYAAFRWKDCLNSLCFRA